MEPQAPSSASPVSLEGADLSDIPEDVLNSENPEENIRLWKLIQTGGAETKPSVIDHVFAPFQKSEQIAASAFKFLSNVTPGKVTEKNRSEAAKSFSEAVTSLFDPRKTFVPNDDYFSWVEAVGETKEKINQSGIPDFLGRLSHIVPAANAFRTATGTNNQDFDKAFGKLMVSNTLDTLAVLNTVALNPDNAIGTRVLRFGDRLDALTLKDGTALSPRGEKELGRFFQKIKTARPELGLEEVRNLAEKQLLLNISRGKDGFVDVGGVTFLGKQFETAKFTHKIAEKIFDAPVLGPAVKAVGKAFNKYSGLDHGTEAYFRQVDDAQHAFNQIGERQIEMLTRSIPEKELTNLTRMLDSGEWHLADGSKALNKFGDTQQDVLVEFDKFFRDIYSLEKKYGVEIESLKNYVPLVLKDPKKADEFLEIISRIPSQNDPFSAHRKLASLADAEHLGLEWDLRKLAQIRLRAASKAIAHRKLLGGLSEQLAHQGDNLVTPDSFKFYAKSAPLPDSPQGLAEASKNLLEFPDDVKEAIKTFDRLDLKTELLRSPDMPKRLAGHFLQGLDGIHNFFKNNVTVLFPTFHTRNSLSNVMLNFYDVGGEIFRADNHKLVGQVFDQMLSRKGKTAFRTTKKKSLGDLIDQTEQAEARKALRSFTEDKKMGLGPVEGTEAVQKFAKNLDVADEEKQIIKDLAEIDFFPDNVTLQRILSRTDAWERPIKSRANFQKISPEVKQANKILKDGAKAKPGDKAVALTDRFGREYTIDEITDLAEKHKVLTDWKKLTDNTGDNFLNDAFGKHAGSLWGKTKSALGKPFEVGRRSGTRIENEGRLLNFVANLRRGHSPQEAAMRTKKFLFDYGGLAPVEREFFARMIPFYSFGRYNTALTADMLMRAPGRLAAPLRYAKGLTEQLSGIDPQERPEWAPSYLGERGFYLNTNMKTKGMHRFITSTGAPMEDINRFADVFRDPMGSTFPTIKWMMRAHEVLGGQLPTETFKRDPVTGKFGQISDKAPDSFAILANLPDAVKKFIGFDERLVMAPGGDEFKQTYLNPYLLEVIRNLGFSRGAITADKVFDESLPLVDRFLAIASPVSTKILDEEKEAAKKAIFQANTVKGADRQLRTNLNKESIAADQREGLAEAKEKAKKKGMTLKEYLAEQNKATSGAGK